MSSWAAMVEEVMLQPEPRLVPPRRWSVVTDLAFEHRGSVLVIGAPLGKRVARAVAAAAEVEHVPTIARGLELMAAAKWSVVVVSAGVEDESDGLRFVRALKCSEKLIGAAEALVAVKERYRKTPFVVQPLAGDTEFAVFRSPVDWTLDDTERVPLERVILGCAAGG